MRLGIHLRGRTHSDLPRMCSRMEQFRGISDRKGPGMERCERKHFAGRRYRIGDKRSQGKRLLIGDKGRHESEKHPPHRKRSRHRLQDRGLRPDATEIRIRQKGLREATPIKKGCVPLSVKRSSPDHRLKFAIVR